MADKGVSRGSLMPKAPCRAMASSGMRREAGDDEEEFVLDDLVGRPIGEGRRARRAANAKDAARGGEEAGRWLTVRTAGRPEEEVEEGRGG